MRRETAGAVDGQAEPISATAVPDRLAGFRTMFTGLHHFPPAEAGAILADAARRRSGIGVFEITERSMLSLVGMLFLPLFVLLATPFIHPFRWSRLLLTYVLPLVPLAVWFDGAVSCLRSYTPDELLELARGSDDQGTEWKAGRISTSPFMTSVTYLIGVPKRNA